MIAAAVTGAECPAAATVQRVDEQPSGMPHRTRSQAGLDDKRWSPHSSPPGSGRTLAVRAHLSATDDCEFMSAWPAVGERRHVRAGARRILAMNPRERVSRGCHTTASSPAATAPRRTSRRRVPRPERRARPVGPSMSRPSSLTEGLTGSLIWPGMLVSPERSPRTGSSVHAADAEDRRHGASVRSIEGLNSSSVADRRRGASVGRRRRGRGSPRWRRVLLTRLPARRGGRREVGRRVCERGARCCPTSRRSDGRRARRLRVVITSTGGHRPFGALGQDRACPPPGLHGRLPEALGYVLSSESGPQAAAVEEPSLMVTVA